MKKFAAFVLALLLVLSATALATSDNTFGPDRASNQDTNVTYTVNPSYTVTIPANVTLGGGNVNVAASNVVIPKGKQMVVKLTGASGANNTFKVTTAEGAELDYAVSMVGTDDTKTPVSIGAEILIVNPDDSASGSAQLLFSQPTSVTYAGTYTGIVTFTVSVEDVPAASGPK